MSCEGGVVSNCEVSTVPAAVHEIIETSIKNGIDRKLFDALIQQFIAEMYPETTIHWLRIVRLAENECRAVCLRQYRACVIEQQRKASLRRSVVRQLFPKKKSFTIPELKQLAKETKRLREEPRFQHELLSATAVVDAASSLQKLDAMIERADRQCIILRAECEAFTHRAARAMIHAEPRRGIDDRGSAPMFRSTALLSTKAAVSSETISSGNDRVLVGEVKASEVASKVMAGADPVQRPPHS
jgi:hypothetical protein